MNFKNNIGDFPGSPVPHFRSGGTKESGWGIKDSACLATQPGCVWGGGEEEKKTNKLPSPLIALQFNNTLFSLEFITLISIANLPFQPLLFTYSLVLLHWNSDLPLFLYFPFGLHHFYYSCLQMCLTTRKCSLIWESLSDSALCFSQHLYCMCILKAPENICGQTLGLQKNTNIFGPRFSNQNLCVCLHSVMSDSLQAHGL